MFKRFIAWITGTHTVETALAPMTTMVDRLHAVSVRETAAALAHTAAATLHNDYAIASHTVSAEAALFKKRLSDLFA